MGKKIVTEKKAPHFSLPDQDGKMHTLEEFTRNGPVVFVFYPGDFTPVCTKQLCQYRDQLPEIQKLGYQVVGISHDSAAKHQEFKKEYGLTFPLLTDAGHEVAKAFGATSKFLFGGATRANFIVDRNNHIVFEHIDGVPVTYQKGNDLLAVLKSL